MTANKFSFRSLHEELMVGGYTDVRGFHDFERVFVIDKYMGNRLVAGHEMIHDKLLMETSFGGLQALFREAINNTREANTKSCMSNWLKLLIENSVVTHETAATYLSIKSLSFKGLPSSNETDLLVTMPEKYKEYYYNLSNVVDAVFSSTFAQYIVAKIIVEVVMSPRLVERLISWTPNKEIELRDDEKPDKRLNDLLYDIGPRMQELAQHLYRSLNAARSDIHLDTSFDYQDEDHWLQLGIEDASKIDSWMHDIVRPWIYSVAKGLWPVLAEEWLQLNNRVYKTVWRYVDDFHSTIDYEFIKRIKLDKSDIHQALRYGISSISNRSIEEPSSPIPIENDVDPLSLFKEPSGPRSFITSKIITNDSIPSWYSLVPAKQSDNVYARHISHQLFIKALQRRQWFVGMGAPFEEVESIVVGVNSGDAFMFQDLHNEIVELHTVGNGVFDLDKIFWYLAGDFFWWYDLLTSIDDNLELLPLFSPKLYPSVQELAQRKFRSLDEMIANAKNKDSPLDVDLGFGAWFILRSSKVQGLMLRILPVTTFPGFDEILNREFESGVLKVVPLGDREKLSDRAYKAGRMIITCWPTF